MRFNDSTSIFRQIGNYIEELILAGDYPENERIPSVRELAAQMEVNPNTVIRTYGQLQEGGVIYNQRGMGYFVAAGAGELILRQRKEQFISRELPKFFHSMEILGLNMDDINREYRIYRDSLKDAGNGGGDYHEKQ